MPFYLMAFMINGAVGIFLVGSLDRSQLTETAVVEASLAILGGAAGLAWIWVIQTRINTANYFLATVNLQAFVSETASWRWSKLACAIAVGAVVFALMCMTDIFSYLLTALNYQGVVVASWVGIALSYVLAERGATNVASVIGSARSGVVAWIAGVLVGWTVMSFGGRGASLPAPLAMLAAVVVYRIGRRLHARLER
jgi:hypothetical protein